MPPPSWRARLAERRVKPGDGRPLPPFRWWQVVTRTLFVIEATDTGARPATAPVSYAVDIRQWGDRDDGDVRARLYRDGALDAVSRQNGHALDHRHNHGSERMAVHIFWQDAMLYVESDPVS